MGSSLLYVIAFVALIAAVVVVVRVLQAHALENRKVDDRTANQIRADLLDYIERKSPEPGRVVGLTPFWEGRGLTWGDKYAVLQPLLEREVLVRPRERSGDVRIPDWMFFRLPDSLELSQREWHRMVRGGVQSTTIIEQVDMSRTWNTNTNVGSGQIVASQSGGRGTSQVIGSPVNQPSIPHDEEYRNLIRQFESALREAPTALDEDTQAEARNVLKRAEQQLRDGADRSVVARTVHTIRDIAVGAAGAGAWVGVAAVAEHLLKLLGT
jgi:hypothetical protein